MLSGKIACIIHLSSQQSYRLDSQTLAITGKLHFSCLNY